MTGTPATRRVLRALAHRYGIQTAYYNVDHQRVEASPEALLAALRVLGAPVEGIHDVTPALRERTVQEWRWQVEPVSVAWDEQPSALDLRLPSRAAGRLRCALQREDGGEQAWNTRLEELPEVKAAEIEGERFSARTVALPALPDGYHRLVLESDSRRLETLVIAAPTRSYAPERLRRWGVFLPLYALRSGRSWGIGDLTDLQALGDWTSALGGDVVATLPLLAAFLDDPLVVSPYSPASRLFWNEVYLDVPGCLNRLGSTLDITEAVRHEIAALNEAGMVDYRATMALKRGVLQEAADHLFAASGPDRERLGDFVRGNPEAESYARFRALTERLGPWRGWPGEATRELPVDVRDETSHHYHLVAQWLAEESMQALRERARAQSHELYLDLPLGVHPDGYDAWRYRSVFADGAKTGAPPDSVFTTGQNWGFAPLHPERIRESGYEYVIAYLRHHLRHASLLRIDHVMGLHRLFWIPDVPGLHEGVYVRNHPDEMYAILSLESHRHRASIVGENLGTVPPYVNPALDRHGIARMYVLHYELRPDLSRSLNPVPANAVASLNTHDMPPFAAFLEGLDIDERVEAGVLDRGHAESERKWRLRLRLALIAALRARRLLAPDADDSRSVLESSLALLADSRARLVLVNLEDLWGETRPQNIPGTGDERPNWRRKARFPIEEIERMPGVAETLLALDARRRGREAEPAGAGDGR